MKPKSVRVLAPAKVNLTLHVTGRREDGYHEIDSLVAFAPVCDTLHVRDANVASLTIEGPEAEGVPADMRNLALQAATLFPDDPGVSLLLEKQLPSAAGIGGGSADAAAAIRAMLFRSAESAAGGSQDLSDDTHRDLTKKIGELGADVPMCLLSKTCRARGIGDKVEVVTLPPLPALLVNPRVSVATADVFAALSEREHSPMPDKLPEFENAAELTDWLHKQRNDLEGPAIGKVAEIGELLDTLWSTDDCRLARMSGSGATCFGLFPDKEATLSAERLINEARPDWWTSAGTLGDLSNVTIPEFA